MATIDAARRPDHRAEAGSSSHVRTRTPLIGASPLPLMAAMLASAPARVLQSLASLGTSAGFAAPAPGLHAPMHAMRTHGTRA